jgi:hypothetical protein
MEPISRVAVDHNCVRYNQCRLQKRFRRSLRFSSASIARTGWGDLLKRTDAMAGEMTVGALLRTHAGGGGKYLLEAGR